jgi:hypothetical protein
VSPPSRTWAYAVDSNPMLRILYGIRLKEEEDEEEEDAAEKEGKP